MGRWEPNAQGRLEEAALELYLERGYEATTVAEIARRAGLTERTFFRYFADKREVLFAGSSALREVLVSRVQGAVPDRAPLLVVADALAAAGEQFELGHARRRQAVIDAHPMLQERELIKLATLAGALAEALRERQVLEPTASLTAEAGIAAFKVAFVRWLGDLDERRFAHHLTTAFGELHRLAAAI